ncbi:unnamed protein product [Parnassius apollo]|uniref:(apollo) hypothetical protein n=1 Tax=Parnassius apollo TaxID=110799 RepID=A0A8S3YA48_PARAO|nr:unnamed protein product [Parnassius apollo]
MMDEDEELIIVCFICHARLIHCRRLQQQAIESNAVLEQLLAGGSMSIPKPHEARDKIQFTPINHIDIWPVECDIENDCKDNVFIFESVKVEEEKIENENIKFEVNRSHETGLQILVCPRAQREISAISEKCAVFQDTYVKKDDLKFEFDKYHKNTRGQLISHPNVNSKRGGSCLQDSPDCDSGPMGLMTVRNDNYTSTMTVQKQIGDHLSLSDASACAVETDKSVLFTHVQQVAHQEYVEAPRQVTAVSNAHEANAFEAPAHLSLSCVSDTEAEDHKAVSVAPVLRSEMATRALVSSESAGVMTSCNVVNADIQSAVNKQDFQSDEHGTLKQRVDEIARVAREQTTSATARLQYRIDSLEQQARQTNIDICNVPERRNENLTGIIEQRSTSPFQRQTQCRYIGFLTHTAQMMDLKHC